MTRRTDRSPAVEWELDDGAIHALGVASPALGAVTDRPARRRLGRVVVGLVTAVIAAATVIGRLGDPGPVVDPPLPAPAPPGATRIDAIVTDLAGQPRLVRVDLDGRVVAPPVELDAGAGVTGTLARRAGRFLTSPTASPQWLGDGPSTAPAAAGVAGAALVPAAAPDAAWAIGPGPVARLIVAPAGFVTARVTLPFGADRRVLGDDGTGALLVSSPAEGTVRVRPGRPATAVSANHVITGLTDRHVEVSCRLAVCSLRHVPTRPGDPVVDLGPLPGITSHSSLELPLARYRPDGGALAVADFGGPAGRARLRVVDLATGATSSAPVGQRPSELAWTDDATTLVYLEAGSLWAWRPGGATTTLVLARVTSFSMVPG